MKETDKKKNKIMGKNAHLAKKETNERFRIIT